MVDSGAILVFDLGTSYFKTTLFGMDGALLALVRVATPFTNTKAPRSEVSVGAFDEALLSLARDLQAQAPDAYATIRAVTFSSQTNTFALFDADDEPLSPFVVWNDRRATASGELLDQLRALPGFYERTGVPGLSPEFMVAKLHWFQRETPELWERVARIALISDYFTSRFTGRFVTEAGAAGLTGLVDIHEIAWWPEALETADLDPGLLPEIARAGASLGAITPEARHAFQLPEACQFVVGCLDQYAGAIGAGNSNAGDVSETTGTVLATVRCAGQFDAGSESGVFWGPTAEPGRYYQMVFGDVSGNLLEAYRSALPSPVEFEALSRMAQSAAGGRALPQGLDTPELLDLVREWARKGPDGADVRAILEGVAEALKAQVVQLCGNALPAEIHSVGGAARSPLWMGIKADTLGIPLRAVDCPEPTSLGAALLAIHGLSGTAVGDLASAYVRLAPATHPAH